MRTRWPVRDEGGFVMVMVVLLLFAVAVAGATGYQLVAIEADLASGAEESQTALAAARAGLERFVGEHIGVPADTTTYVIADADVYVMTRRVVGYTAPATPDIYLIEAVAELEDEQHPGSPARRTVRQYARLNKEPVHVTAALMSVAGTVTTNDTVRGTDQSPNGGYGKAINVQTGACAGTNPVVSVAGVAAITSTASGSIAPTGTVARLAYSSAANVIDTAGVRWSVLESASFPIPYSGTWPTFGSLPADSFPIVRMSGNLTITNSNSVNGRGVLIVPGTFSVNGLGASFQWDGIVLAGAVSNTLTSGLLASLRINGALVAGLDGGAQTTLTTKSTGFFGALASDINYYSCYVAKANRVLAYFSLIDGTRWEF